MFKPVHPVTKKRTQLAGKEGGGGGGGGKFQLLWKQIYLINIVGKRAGVLVAAKSQ